MRIAQISPLYESVPPRQYGGTERVVSYLTEELVRQGHEVTLFASGDSRTSARLVPCVDQSLRLDRRRRDDLLLHFAMLERVVRSAGDFEVLHFHLDFLGCPFSSRCEVPHVTTLHGRLDIPDLPLVWEAYPHEPVVSISDA